MDTFGQFGAVCCHGDDIIYRAAERTLAESKKNRCDYWLCII